MELFGTGTISCPVAAWKKWRQVDKYRLSPTKPVFRTHDGTCFTGAQFNDSLKLLLGKYVNYEKNKFLSHSFRAGMASMMALAGYSDEEIQECSTSDWHVIASLVGLRIDAPLGNEGTRLSSMEQVKADGRLH